MSGRRKHRQIVLPGAHDEAGVAMEFVGKKSAGRELDGQTWNQVPNVKIKQPASPSAAGRDDGRQRSLPDGAGGPVNPEATAAEQKNQSDASMVKPARDHRKSTSNPMQDMRCPEQPEFVIDKGIAALIPSLSDEELAQLERSILAEGCRESLIVWDDGQRKILLDGHNRHEICRRHERPYKVKYVELVNRDAAIRWVTENQLGRRNLTTQAQSYLRGTLYNGMKRQGSRSDLTSGQSDQKSTTAQQLAEQYKIAEKTVRRDGQFAEQLDTLAEAVGSDIKNQVLARDARISRADIRRLLALDQPMRSGIMAKIREGAKASVLLRHLPPRACEHDDRREKNHGGVGLTHRHVQNNEISPETGGTVTSFSTAAGLAQPSGATSTGPESRSTGDMIGHVNTALKHLTLAAGMLRSLAPGSISLEDIEHVLAQLQAIKNGIESQRQRIHHPPSQPSVNVLAAAQAVFELERKGILSMPLMAVDVILADPSDSQALQKQLVEVRKMIKRGAGSQSRSSKNNRCIRAADDVSGEGSAMTLPFKTFGTIQRYLQRQIPNMEKTYNQYAQTRAENQEHSLVCEKIDCFIENGGLEIADSNFSYFDYLRIHHADGESFREAVPAAMWEMAEYFRAQNHFSDEVLERMRQSARDSQWRSARSGRVTRVASSPGPSSLQPRYQSAPAHAVATAPGGPLRQGSSASAPAPARADHAARLPDPAVASIAAQPRECLAPEEIEREVTRIIDDLRSGRLRRPFQGEHEILRKKWPTHTRNGALKLFRSMLNSLSASRDVASLQRADISVAAAPPDAAPSATGNEMVSSQTSAPTGATVSASPGSSKPDTFAMREAMGLASAASPGTLARAMKLACAARSRKRMD